MLLTVIMPVYNCEKYIRFAIDSVLNQTFSDFTLLIINDGSTDNTENIICEFSDSRITYLKNEKNMGIAYTRNKGIKCSDSKYIAWMDSDDISLPDRLRNQIDFLENNTIYDLCFTNVKTIDKDNNILSKQWFNKKSNPVEWDILWCNPVPQPSVMIKRELLIKNDLWYDESLTTAEDYDLWTRFALKARMARLDDVLLLYRVTESSAYHSNERLALANSLESNLILIKNITGEEPPAFHKYLTIFHQALGYQMEFVDVILLKKWMNRLITLQSTQWCWDDIQVVKVEKNSKKILTDYVEKLDKRTLIKNVFRLRHMGFIFYIRMFFLFMKFIYKKIVSIKS